MCVHAQLPVWLENSFLGKANEIEDPPENANAFPPAENPWRGFAAPWKAFAPTKGSETRGANPTVLLNL